jgi:hypothetical protein
MEAIRTQDKTKAELRPHAYSRLDRAVVCRVRAVRRCSHGRSRTSALGMRVAFQARASCAKTSSKRDQVYPDAYVTLSMRFCYVAVRRRAAF